MNPVRFFLKKFIPRPLFNAVFEYYCRARIATVDRLLFPEFEITRDSFKIYRKAYPFSENNISISDIPDQKVRNFMEHWYGWSQEEFILELGRPCYIEPDYGWSIVPPNKLLYYSLGISRTWFLPKPKFFKFLRKTNVQHVYKAISLRDSGEENYFHFFNDVIAKIFFLKKHIADFKEYPLVVCQNLWEKPFFQNYMRASGLRGMRWLIQSDQYIYSERTIFCKPLTHRPDLYRQIFSHLERKSVQRTRKLFLTRGRNRSRWIANQDEIKSICVERGIELVDADFLSPSQQIEIFSEAKLVVGVHGAGLTNVYLCEPPCQVLEIFPPATLGYLPFHYIMVAKMKNLRYDALIGELKAFGFSDGFYLNPKIFQSKVNELLNETTIKENISR